MRVVWSEHARRQAVEIFTFIAEDRPAVAEQVLDDLVERTDLLAEFPEQGQPWGHSARPGLRSVLVHSFRVVYAVEDEVIMILSVRHTRRKDLDPEDV